MLPSLVATRRDFSQSFTERTGRRNVDSSLCDTSVCHTGEKKEVKRYVHQFTTGTQIQLYMAVWEDLRLMRPSNLACEVDKSRQTGTCALRATVTTLNTKE